MAREIILDFAQSITRKESLVAATATPPAFYHVLEPMFCRMLCTISDSQKGYKSMKTLTFLHTSPVHIATFERLIAEIEPAVPVKHIVDESLLQDARAFGITLELIERITRTIQQAIDDDAAVVMCTCSTIGGSAEQLAMVLTRPILRIDRAMAERAVALGSRIVVAVALTSTLEPTRQLLLDAAAKAGKTISIVDLLCEGAWERFEHGDHSGYVQIIAASLHDAAWMGDVLVLAQASMSDAAALCGDLPIPILSSPQPGLEAAIQAYHAENAAHG